MEVQIPAVIGLKGRPQLIIIFFFNNLFIASLGLRCCVQAFSSSGRWELLSSCDAGASPCGAQALGARASVVAALRL